MLGHRGIGMTSQRTKERLIERLKSEGVKNLEVLNVIREIPRHLFVDEALSSRAYEDNALPIGYGQTISQPYIVARMTELLIEHEQPVKYVLEVGTGSGYQTAVLSRLVTRIFSVERIKGLHLQAQKLLRELQIRNIKLKHSDGGMGMPEYAPFDGIIVTAAPEGIPLGLIDQLKPGGILVLPVGTREEQVLVRVIKTEDGYEKEMIERVSFVPLLGGIT